MFFGKQCKSGPGGRCWELQVNVQERMQFETKEKKKKEKVRKERERGVTERK